MSSGWPPALAFFGLHVDCGRWHPDRQKWLRLPVAAFTCRHGCEYTAVGAADVAHLTQTIDATHARTCPGPSGGTA
ncbi:hypothetical protein ACKI1S_46630 [Streptomyces galilaeus]|uniref:Uncharacterized protein n=1 Tax=Streptomyces galilaeus TaxID=33899 RepID=A0ABW9IYM3_STRGJ